jgi:hypothetical protein
VGDVFTIPTLSDEYYGIGQIAKRENKRNTSMAFMSLTEKVFHKSEIKNICYADLKDNTILSVMPLDLMNITDKRWKIFSNFPVNHIDLPLFKLYSANSPTIPNNYVIIDLGFNFFRPAENNEVDRLSNYFNRSSIYFENLINFTHYDNTLLDKFDPDYIHYWPENVLTEIDLKTNSANYKKWMGFGSPWVK